MEGCCLRHMGSLTISSRHLLAVVVLLGVLSTAVLVAMVTMSISADHSSFTQLSPTNDFFRQLSGNARHTEMYLFNWTNSNAFLESNGSVKPAFTEIGPFVFEEKMKFVNISFHDTVTFQVKKTWHFISNQSADLSTYVVNLNVVGAAVVYLLRDTQNPKAITALNHFINVKEPFVTNHTAGELLFEGYRDNTLTNINLLFNHSVPFEKFGWFHGKNNSISGVYQFSTSGDLMNYSGLSSSPNRGLISADFLPRRNGETISLFDPNICGQVNYDYVGDIETATRSETTSKFAAETTSLDADQHCAASCPQLFSGVMSLSSCLGGLPFVYSFPHFYLADPRYMDSVRGLRPQPQRHESYVLMDTHTQTVPLEVRSTHQMNILIEHLPWATKFSNLTFPQLIPMVWYKETWRLDDDLVIILHNKSNSTVVLSLIPILILFVACICICVYLYRKRIGLGLRHQQLL